MALSTMKITFFIAKKSTMETVVETLGFLHGFTSSVVSLSSFVKSPLTMLLTGFVDASMYALFAKFIVYRLPNPMQPLVPIGLSMSILYRLSS